MCATLWARYTLIPLGFERTPAPAVARLEGVTDLCGAIPTPPLVWRSPYSDLRQMFPGVAPANLAGGSSEQRVDCGRCLES